VTRIEIPNISTGQEHTIWFDGDLYGTPEYFQGIGKYPVENQFTAFTTEDG
jgi:hypothetical protein